MAPNWSIGAADDRLNGTDQARWPSFVAAG
jgi:hypothetical protein